MFEFSIPVTALLNTLAWPVVQMSLAWAFTQVPWTFFSRPQDTASAASLPARTARLPGQKRQQLIHRMKAKLPDGASWFDRGFPKARLTSLDAAYLQRFVAETRRGELSHWAMLAVCPAFFTYNPLWASLVMCAVGLILNLPCIVVQHYNRQRLLAVLHRQWGRDPHLKEHKRQ